jgi:hypothetical protein
LDRGNLRNIVILISAISAVFYPIKGLKITFSLTILAAGCALHFIVKGVLVRNKILCKDGVYTIVRHPYYLANYLIDSSFCLLSGNSYMILLYPFLFFWAYGPSLKQEENLLASLHGEIYLNHHFQTPQVFPYALSIKQWQKTLRAFSMSRITSQEIKRIFRFWGIAFLLIFLHDIRLEKFLEIKLLSEIKDIGNLFVLGLCLMFFFISFTIPRKISGPPVQ